MIRDAYGRLTESAGESVPDHAKRENISRIGWHRGPRAWSARSYIHTWSCRRFDPIRGRYFRIALKILIGFGCYLQEDAILQPSILPSLHNYCCSLGTRYLFIGQPGSWKSLIGQVSSWLPPVIWGVCKNKSRVWWFLPSGGVSRPHKKKANSARAEGCRWTL